MDPVKTERCISSDEDMSDEDNTWDTFSDSKRIVSKKKSRAETESSSENSYLVAHVTSSNLSRDTLNLLRGFARSNGLNERCCEIDLMNQHGKSWTLSLRCNATADRACIRGGWRNFCFANGLEAGSSYKFKLVRNGTKPLLRLCSDIIQQGSTSKANGKYDLSEKPSRYCSERASVKQNKFLTLTFKPYMLQSGQLRLPRHFARENGIKEAEEITLMDKDGVKWPSYVVSVNKQGGFFYMAKGWRNFVAASRLTTGETFTLEFVRGEGTTPLLKLCSKAKIMIEQVPFNGPRGTVQASEDEEEEVQEETEARFQKRARVSLSNKCISDQVTEKHKLPFQHCPITDQVAKVKQSIVDVLTSVRQFKRELEIKEHNLGISLQEIDCLGEKILEISKIFNSDKV